MVYITRTSGSTISVGGGGQVNGSSWVLLGEDLCRFLPLLFRFLLEDNTDRTKNIYYLLIFNQVVI